MDEKITIKQIISYAEVHGKESAANLMLLAGPDSFDLDYGTYCDIVKILQMED